MQQNDYLVAKIGVDTAENEPRKESCGRGADLRHGCLGSLRSRHITLSEARSRLYRRRSLQVNSHFAAFFKIYKIFTILRRSNLKILQNFVKIFGILKKNLQNFANFQKKSKFFEIFEKFLKILDNFLQNLSSERCKSVQIL